VRRISGRRTCADCGRVFNVSTSPAQLIESEPCQSTGGSHRLIQRPDDNEATVAERLRVYEEKTRPLIEFYRARGLLRVINAEGSVEEVTERLEQALHAATRTAAQHRPTRSTERRSSKKRGGKQIRLATRRRRKSAAKRSRKRAARVIRASAQRVRATARRASAAKRSRAKGKTDR
jgi:adenylate kinase